jgi:ABC-type transport system involved in multi-copper enzyme maturation permease subunit
MLNLLRADAYRLLRGKAIYIALAVYLALVVLQVLTGSEGTVGIEVSYGEDGVQPSEGISALALTASSAPLVVMAEFQALIFVALVPIFVVAGADVGSGTLQNSMAAGFSRAKLYLSKFILNFVCIELFYAVSLLVGALIGAIVGGAGDAPEGFALSCLRVFGTQSLMALAVASVGTAIVFITRKGAAISAVYLTLFMGMTIALLSIGEATSLELIAYDFLANASLATSIDQLPAEQVAKMFSVIAVYLALSMTLGLTVFRKAEVR